MTSVLQPNPSGCLQFESNVFRKEKCKHCGHPWRLHLGVISDSVVQSFMNANGEGGAASSSSAGATVPMSKAKAKAKVQAKSAARHQHRAIEDEWLFEGELGQTGTPSSDSEGDGGFRMHLGSDFSPPVGRAASLSGGTASWAGPKIINLLDLSECDLPAQSHTDPVPVRIPWAMPSLPASGAGPAPTIASASSSRQPQATGGMSSAESSSSAPPPAIGRTVSTPVEKEEISYLRQMLADAQEEKAIQIAIVQDKLDEQQSVLDTMSRQNAHKEAQLREAIEELERAGTTRSGETTGVAERLKAMRHMQDREEEFRRREEEFKRREEELTQRELKLTQATSDAEAVAQARGVEIDQMKTEVMVLEEHLRKASLDKQSCEGRLASTNEELEKSRQRLGWWEADDKALISVGTEDAICKWERDLWQAMQKTMGRLTDRRVVLSVQAAEDKAVLAATEHTLCKICYDKPISCALLPCRHHAFCEPCSRKVKGSSKPLCPLCRTSVIDIFETFAG